MIDSALLRTSDPRSSDIVVISDDVVSAGDNSKMAGELVVTAHVQFRSDQLNSLNAKGELH